MVWIGKPRWGVLPSSPLSNSSAWAEASARRLGNTSAVNPREILSASGIGLAHWTHAEAQTGCTVVVLPEGSVASGEIRGSAPATREFGLLDPLASVQSVDAIVLSGGSAFGLSAADGVVDELEAAGRGYPTTFGPVPIVVAMSLFDLGVGTPNIRPGPTEGAEAARAALAGEVQELNGPIGAGTGATSGKWGGPATTRAAGFGFHMIQLGEVWVAALVAVNAFGFVGSSPPAEVGEPWKPAIGDNTTIGVLLTNATLEKSACHHLARAGHDGYAKSIFPAHTAVDGDAVVAAATASTGALAHPMQLRAAAELAMAHAVLSTVSPEAEKLEV